jgi:hypothetical protein
MPMWRSMEQICSRMEIQAREEERIQTTNHTVRWYKSLCRDEVDQKDRKKIDVEDKWRDMRSAVGECWRREEEKNNSDLMNTENKFVYWLALFL